VDRRTVDATLRRRQRLQRAVQKPLIAFAAIALLAVAAARARPRRRRRKRLRGAAS
jgi:hypothetical protein